MPKLQMKLDKQDSGLPLLAGKLAASPQARRLALVVCDCSKIETDMDTGAESVTVRVSRLEEVPAGSVGDAVALLQAAVFARTHVVGVPDSPVFPEGTVIDVNTGEITVPSVRVDEPSLFDDVQGADDVDGGDLS